MQENDVPCFSRSVTVTCKLKFDPNCLDKLLVYPPFELQHCVPRYQLAAKVTRKIKDGVFEYRTTYTVTTENNYKTVDTMLMSEVSKDFVIVGTEMIPKATSGRFKKFTVNFKSPPLSDVGLTVTCSYAFNTCGTARNYSFQLCDALMFEEMNCCANTPLADVVLKVSGRVFNVHKAIMCARSPVFASMLASDDCQLNCCGQTFVEINDISADTFTRLFNYLYTGLLSPDFYSNEELAYCAVKYQLETLVSLFGESSVKTLTGLKRRITDCKDHNMSWERGSFEEEPRHSKPTHFHDFSWEYSFAERGKFQFMDVDMEVSIGDGKMLRFLCWNPDRIGLRIHSVHYRRKAMDCAWKAMEKCVCNQVNEGSQLPAQLNAFPHFTATNNFPFNCRIHFRVFFVESSDCYSFFRIDRIRGKQLWAAAKNRLHTDVDFVVGHKTFPAHQVIVAARSPYFARVFDKKNFDVGKYHVEDCNPAVFEQLLFFLYTGFLQAPADNEFLLQAAEKFEVSTLKTLCRAALESSLESVQEDGLLYLSTLFE